MLAIQRQPGTNTIEVTDNVKNLLPVFQHRASAVGAHGHSLRPVARPFASPYQDVKFTMLMTLALVIGVIFLFLRNVSATVIPSLALPFSIVGTFAIMYMLSYSLDNLSMMALILVGRLRGGRRHRDAGKHFPAYGDGARSRWPRR